MHEGSRFKDTRFETHVNSCHVKSETRKSDLTRGFCDVTIKVITVYPTTDGRWNGYDLKKSKTIKLSIVV